MYNFSRLLAVEKLHTKKHLQRRFFEYITKLRRGGVIYARSHFLAITEQKNGQERAKMKNKRHFEHYICYHVLNRIKVHLYDGQGGETYSLDMPKEVFEKMLEIMTEFKNGTYKPSNEFKDNYNE